ncbi:hypothetical protein QFC22_004291 [Naganishia vaughanmartiniae]|uniref:Uncharacterized protein n=1 Tax=Naganishia vaughanmartiniae TaxID=1424756 RepID=A0ACC2X1D5_9TREE|nr:hypothetical protein QFC22_004291 [Naganishia vaughanmartiniae]
MQAIAAGLSTEHQDAIPNPNLNPAAVGSHHAKENINSVVSATAQYVGPRSSSLHAVTPLLYSKVLSDRTGHDVYLKLDCWQPSGSFKIRGIGAEIMSAYVKYGDKTHIITSSGGNAGLAAAVAAKTLGVKCTVIVPRRTEASIVRTLKELGAEVDNDKAEAWDDADRMARQILEREPEATYVHPFEGEALTKGHATLVEEIRVQLGEAGVKDSRPDMIVCSVGGGGLIRGIIKGIEAAASDHPEFGKPQLVGVQDFGADSFSLSYNQWLRDGAVGEPNVISIPAIVSKATSMGAKTSSATALSAACRYSGLTTNSQANGATTKSLLSTLIVDDAISGAAAAQFYKDHDIMVEMACGAALVPVYQKRILDRLLSISEDGSGAGATKKKTIAIIVCGGSKIDKETLQQYASEYGTADDGNSRVMIDGQLL